MPKRTTTGEPSLAEQAARMLLMLQAKCWAPNEPGNSEAFDLAWAAVAYLTDGEANGFRRDARTREALLKAHGALVGGSKAAHKDRVLRLIETYVTLGRWAGPSGPQPWDRCAAGLAHATGQPKAIVPELAKRLEGHRVATKSGKSPKGRYTTAEIAEWLTGDPEYARHAKRRASKSRKEK
jgi:hypothetical protein